MGEYGGESNAKKVARSLLWHGLLMGLPSIDDYRDEAWQLDQDRLLNDQSDSMMFQLDPKADSRLPNTTSNLPGVFEFMPVAVLSGPDGFDVQALLTLNVYPHVITAIDNDPVAIERAKGRIAGFMTGCLTDKDRYPYSDHCVDCINWVCGDYSEELRKKGNAIIFMDTCSPILYAAKKTIEAVSLSAQRSPLRTVAAGNELRQRRSCVIFGGMYGRDGRFMPEREYEQADADARRAVRLFERFSGLATAAGAYFQPTICISYTSARKTVEGKTVGTPMLYAGGLLCTVEGVYNGSHRKRMAQRLDAINTGLRRDFCRDASHFVQLGSDTDGSRLKEEAVRLARYCDSQYASDFLALPESTVRAWLAHDTRGTYKAPFAS